ncbi:MAG: UDP-N-acetylglucosamine--N-acetylmuramyl-(pentapeptide) pyrophosphoryl-undecaprenol N-acetylglucosamine transferase [Oscillospiraceae bacterium]|jgi:UDP-N-acetylglucosamine--N-acetylmuramyl-(pentapeptide) pyrophosphoryl-undecaprenol N-acetylglucosamine transferase|nr:UDP-N-acetylglucosamine--N-acetylmuramyl-(pentapeptide) pyrophosphoryl-undecaprenol N-acetylglucosamine transferase [Oscillospiraceae bacterium]
MRIIFVAGGTSGHINPAINVANYLKKNEPDSEILYVGAKNGIEEKMAKDAGFNFKSIKISGFSRKFSLSSIKKNIITIFRIFTSDIESKKILKEFKPDICFGTGGYVCGPLLRQASKLKIPFILQEQNSFPGLTTKILAKKAKKICFGNVEAKKYLHNINCVYTGNPIKHNILEFVGTNCKELNAENIQIKARKILGLDTNYTIILSFGGSLGSPVINDVISEIINTGKYFHIHSYGKNNKNFKLKRHNSHVRAYEYVENMNICMAAADLIICRAGAMTLSELAIFGKPAVLIPSPNVAKNHQFYNAINYAKNYTASVIKESDLTSDYLSKEIKRLIHEKNLKENFLKNLNFNIGSCEKIYKIIKTTLNLSKN